jgi:murein L,D-transpeptidase YafK
MLITAGIVFCIGAAFVLLFGPGLLWPAGDVPAGDGAGTPRQEAPVSPQGLPLPPLTDPRVVVEKTARRLTVIDGERAVKSYRVALGRGRGDKVREGDGCTPEGTFYICHHNPESNYHLSMGLSYPNVEDADRGLRDGLISRSEHTTIVEAIRRRSTPPWNTELGGEIMIHGHGAGRDWTAGCIALGNEDVTELYHALPDGTEVEIRP